MGARWLSRRLYISAGHTCYALPAAPAGRGGGRPVGLGWGGGRVGEEGGEGGGERATVAPADGRPVLAHLGQGACKVTCTLQRCCHVPTSVQVARHAGAVASSLARGYWCCGSGLGDPRAGIGAFHTAYTHRIEAGTAPAATCGLGGTVRDLSPRERHLTVPWVTPTQWPPEPSASSSHPSTRSTGCWGALAQACGVAAPVRRTRREPRS